MLNYLWAGMIILSVISALAYDLNDERVNRYENGKRYNAEYSLTNLENKAMVNIAGQTIYFSLDNKTIQQLQIEVKKSLPASWQLIAEKQSSKNKQQLIARIVEIDDDKKQIHFSLPEVHWVKMNAVAAAAFDVANFAVKLAIGLVGVMALWLGLMRIAEKSGLINYFVRLIYPALHWLFPKIDKDHPVLGSISLNMAANMLGLGNAATPMGIKAMQQLQEINKTKDRASDEMCMFLAINTSSVQLLPPVTLIALMGIGVSELLLPIILATSVSTIAAIASVKMYIRSGKS